MTLRGTGKRKIALLPRGHPQHRVHYRPLDCRSANWRHIEIGHDALRQRRAQRGCGQMDLADFVAFPVRRQPVISQIVMKMYAEIEQTHCSGERDGALFLPAETSIDRHGQVHGSK